MKSGNSPLTFSCVESLATLFLLSLILQVGLEQPEEPDISLASNLERQLLYSARPSLFDNKPVSNQQ